MTFNQLRTFVEVATAGSVIEAARSLLSRDAVARELDEGTLEEWQCASLPRPRAWPVVSRAHEPLPATAGLFLTHLAASGADGFTLVRDAPPD